MRRLRRNGGFTLMELMIVIAIIMILSGAIVARVSTTGERARVAKAMAEIEGITSACRAFNLDTGLWPIVLDGLITEPVQGYNEDYAEQNLPADSWGGPYLETETADVPLDPWEEAYDFSYEGVPRKLYVTAGPLHSEDVRRLVHIFNP